MFDHITRPWHFLIPAAIIIVGGIFMRFETWEYIGLALWVIAAATIYFLLISAAREHELKKIEREHWHVAEIMKLDVAKLKTKVTINKSDIEGTTFTQAYREAPLDPARLQMFAAGILNGRKLRIREWTPMTDGHLMADNEWRDLIAFLKQPDPERKDIKFIEQRNPGVTNSVYDWTPAGTRWLHDIVDTRVLTPLSS